MTASHRAAAQANAKVAPKVSSPEGRACNWKGEGSKRHWTLADTMSSLRRGGSGGTETRTREATGEALLLPRRNGRSKVGRITGDPGKAVEEERVAEGSVVAKTQGNAC